MIPSQKKIKSITKEKHHLYQQEYAILDNEPYMDPWSTQPRIKLASRIMSYTVMSNLDQAAFMYSICITVNDE